MNTGFEKIDPTPLYPPGTSRASFAGRTWDDQAVFIARFKKSIKTDLRAAQMGRCCFCRRVMFDDYATHIEHFIEKVPYGAYAFEIRNLALSCGTCNIQKNAHNISLTDSLNKRAKRQGTAHQLRCPTLVQEVPLGSPLPEDSTNYRWVHPHLDAYSDNINIEKSWVFSGKTLKGTRTIRGVKLNALALIEQRALFERLSARSGKLSTLVAALSELSNHRANEVAAAVAKVLRRRRNRPT